MVQKSPTTATRQSGIPLDKISDAAETIALTSGIGPSGAVPAGYQTGLDLSQIADQSIARLLGGPVAPGQLLERLSAVFPETTTNGVTTFTYRPIGAQPSIGSTGASVSGAQSTIYRQARVLGESISGLLDAMVPVITDPDIADIQATIATFRSTVDAIVQEFGREGGALMQLVSVKTTTLHITLRELKNTLGECADDDTLDLAILERDMIRENVQMLEYLVKQLTDPDEGLVKLYGDKVLKGVSARYAQLVWVVSAVPTTVQQAYLEFDAIRFGSNDRRITSVPDGQGGVISIEQALQWCESSASGTWGQSLGGDARTDDIDIIKNEAAIIEGIVDKIKVYVGTYIPGSRRITAALDDLARQLVQIHEFAKAIAGIVEGQPRAAE